MKRKFVAIIAMALVLALCLGVSPALASPVRGKRVMPKLAKLAPGHRRVIHLTRDATFVTENWVQPVLGPFPSGVRVLTTGGTPVYSGAAVLWTRTDCYNWIGDHVFQYTTYLYWDWYAGRVVHCHWQSPSYVIYGFLKLNATYNGTTWIPGGFRYWRGSSYGAYYAGANGSFVGTVGIYPPRWDVFHDNVVYGNGTWEYYSHINRSGWGS